MARIRIEHPDETFTFSTTLTVRFDDVNAGMHLANDRLVSLLGEARSRFLAHLGPGGRDSADAPDTIVADLAVTYRAQARLRDELRIDVGIAQTQRFGGEIAYRVVRVQAPETPDPSGPAAAPGAGVVVVATASTTLLFFDYAAGRVTSAPDHFLAAAGQGTARG